MLDNLRKFATTWPGKILGAFLLVGLAGFGITGVISSIGGNTVARVGDRDISTLDFQRAYRTQLGQAAQQIGSTPTPEQAIALGIPGLVLTRLATDEALNMLSEKFGMGISEKRLGEILSQDPTFTGALGSFDRTIFNQAIRQLGYTENEYFQLRRQAAERQQVALGIFSRIRSPEIVSKLVRRFGEDRRTLDYVVVGEDSLLPIEPPSDEVLAAYLSDNQDQYRTLETRDIRALVLSPEILAKTIEISDAELLAEYDANKENFIAVESRTMQEFHLSSDAQVRWFEFGLASGKTFEDLLAESGEQAISMGTATRAQLTEEVLAEAAFSLPEGGTAIIDGSEGMRAINIISIQPGGQRSFEDVADQLAQRMKLAKARTLYVDVLDQIEEQRAAFVDMSQTAEEFGLTAVETSLTQTGAGLTEAVGLDPSEAARVAETIFAAEIGGLAPSVPLGANKNFWFDLLKITEAADQTVDDVREQLTADWMAEQRAAALQERANELVQQLEDGIPFNDVAVANGLFPQTANSVSRTGVEAGVIDQAVARAAYGGGVGFSGTALNANGEYVVFKVTQITPAEGELAQANADAITSSYRDDVYSEFANSLREDAQLRVNQGVLNNLLNGGGISGGLGHGADHPDDGH